MRNLLSNAVNAVVDPMMDRFNTALLTPSVVTPSVKPSGSFDDMTKDELMKFCDQSSIAYKKSWTKAKILEAIAKAG